MLFQAWFDYFVRNYLVISLLSNGLNQQSNFIIFTGICVLWHSIWTCSIKKITKNNSRVQNWGGQRSDTLDISRMIDYFKELQLELCIFIKSAEIIWFLFQFISCYVQAEEVWNFALEYAKFRMIESSRSGRDTLVEVTEICSTWKSFIK